MLARRRCRTTAASIINISSIGGLTVETSIGHYNVTKAALIHLTKSLAKDLAPAVRVNAICPGLVKTDMARALWESNEDAVSRDGAAAPPGRAGRHRERSAVPRLGRRVVDHRHDDRRRRRHAALSGAPQRALEAMTSRVPSTSSASTTQRPRPVATWWAPGTWDGSSKSKNRCRRRPGRSPTHSAISACTASSRRSRPGSAPAELDPVVAVDRGAAGHDPAAEQVAEQPERGRQVGDRVHDTAERRDGVVEAGLREALGLVEDLGRAFGDLDQLHHVPVPCRGWMTTSSQSGSERSSPTGSIPAARSAAMAGVQVADVEGQVVRTGPGRVEEAVQEVGALVVLGVEPLDHEAVGEAELGPAVARPSRHGRGSGRRARRP